MAAWSRARNETHSTKDQEQRRMRPTRRTHDHVLNGVRRCIRDVVVGKVHALQACVVRQTATETNGAAVTEGARRQCELRSTGDAAQVHAGSTLQWGRTGARHPRR
jgi:hypothetical protein